MCDCRQSIVEKFLETIPLAEKANKAVIGQSLKQAEAMVGLLGLLDPEGVKTSQIRKRMEDLRAASKTAVEPISEMFRDRLVHAHVIEVVCGGIAARMHEIADPDLVNEPKSGVAWLVEHLEMALAEARMLAAQDERIKAGEKL